MESAGSSDAAAGSVSSRSFLLVETSHNSTRPWPPAIATVRPSGLKSTPSQPPCDDRSFGPSGRHVAVSQSVVPFCVAVASSLPSGLNAAALTGEVNPWSHLWIRDPCSSAPRSAPQEPALSVLVEPAAERRPVADERLVRHLDRFLADGHEPGVGERSQHFARVRLLLSARDQLPDRDPPPRVLGALAQLGQTQEDVARKPLLLGRQLVAVDRLGRFGDRPLHAAGLQVADHGQHPAAPALPCLEEAVRQKRQPAWLPGDVSQNGLHDPGLEHEPHMLSGPLDRAPKLLIAHRADQCLPVLERGGEARIRGAVTVEVGAKSDDDAGSVLGAVEKRVDESGALLLVAAEGER